jgi:hypothetical protein
MDTFNLFIGRTDNIADFFTLSNIFIFFMAIQDNLPGPELTKDEKIQFFIALTAEAARFSRI